MQPEGVALLDDPLGDGVGLRVLLVVSVLGVSVDGAVVLTALVEEVELHHRVVAVLVALATNEPVVGALGLAGYGDVVGRFGLKVDGLVPVACHVANELEGIVELLVVLRQVGRHLQGRIHGEVKGQRAADGDACPRGVVAPGVQLGDEDARRVVHRAALQARKRQDAGVVRP